MGVDLATYDPQTFDWSGVGPREARKAYGIIRSAGSSRLLTSRSVDSQKCYLPPQNALALHELRTALRMWLAGAQLAEIKAALTSQEQPTARPGRASKRA